ncbi:MAG: hypothetical protein RDV41_05840 [Planctomycetota bacterium]|nr:hypothetical protein [Planctomycetota bacterium]
MVPEQDIGKGRALFVEGKAYCPKCKGSAPAQATSAAAQSTALPHQTKKPTSATSSSAVLKRSQIQPGATRTPAHPAGPHGGANSSGILRAAKRPAPPVAMPTGRSPGSSGQVKRLEKSSLTPHGTRKFQAVKEDEADARRSTYNQPQRSVWIYFAVAGAVIAVIVIAYILLSDKSSGPSGTSQGKSAAEISALIDQKIIEVKNMVPEAARNAINTDIRLRELKAAIDEGATVLSIQEKARYDKLYSELRKQVDAVRESVQKAQEFENRFTNLTTGLAGTIDSEAVEKFALECDSLCEDIAGVEGTAEDLVNRCKALQKSAWLRVRADVNTRALQLVASAPDETKAKTEANQQALQILEGLREKVLKRLGDSQDVGEIDKLIDDRKNELHVLSARAAYEDLEQKVNAFCQENKFGDAFDAIDAYPNLYNATEYWRKKDELADAVRGRKREWEQKQQTETPPPDAPTHDQEGFELVIDNGVPRSKSLTSAGDKITWRTEGAELVGRHSSPKLDPPTPQAHNFDGFLSLGEDSWKNYEVKVEFTMKQVGGILGIRADLSQGKPGVPNWLVPPTVQLDSPTSLGVLVDGDSVTVTMNGKTFPPVPGLSTRAPNGRIILALYPGAEIRIKSLKLKRLPE